MKTVLAGAAGHLGRDILVSLLAAGHEVVAADVAQSAPDVQGNFVYRSADMTDPAALNGLCDGAETVISTVGLTKASKTLTNYDIDYKGNLNLLNEAKAAGVKKFVYISVLKANSDPRIPMLHSKYMFEQELERSGLEYIIYRPTGYFYDIVKVFRPMIDKGSVTLLGRGMTHANVVDTPDFADYIVAHLGDGNNVVSIGGSETYTYVEMATMCFEAAGKPVVIKFCPPFVFDMLAFAAKLRRSGAEGLVRFSKWTLSEEMVGDVKCGGHSFAEYIKKSFEAGE